MLPERSGSMTRAWTACLFPRTDPRAIQATVYSLEKAWLASKHSSDSSATESRAVVPNIQGLVLDSLRECKQVGPVISLFQLLVPLGLSRTTYLRHVRQQDKL